MCQPDPDFNTRHAEAGSRYAELRELLHDRLVPRAPNQLYVIDGIVAEALGFADDDQHDRVERGLSGANAEQIEVALAQLEGLLRAYAAYAQHCDFTRRSSWFARLLRRA